MSGWKTRFSAVGLFFTGVGTVIAGVDVETWTFDGDKLTTGCGMMATAFGIFGIGHKADKIGKIIKAK